MLAIVADAAIFHAISVVEIGVEGTADGVVVTGATFAFVGGLVHGWGPGFVVVEGFAAFAVSAVGVVHAFALAVDLFGKRKIRVRNR